MKNIILFDVNQQHFDLLPLAFTRPVSDIRIGILTIREKWEHRLPGMYSYLTPEYMAAKYPAALSDDNIFIASHILPDDSLVKQISDLDPGEAIVCNQELLVFRGNEANFRNERYNRTIEYDHTLKCIRHLYDIFLMNGECLETDFRLITNGRTSEPYHRRALLSRRNSQDIFRTGSTCRMCNFQRHKWSHILRERLRNHGRQLHSCAIRCLRTRRCQHGY